MAVTHGDILVKDAGEARVATAIVNIGGVTQEVQFVSLIDPDTNTIFKIDSSGRVKIVLDRANTPSTSTVTIAAGVTPTLILSSTSTTKHVILQNFSETGSNPVMYLGGSNVGVTNGVGILDGGSVELASYTGTLYGILSAGATLSFDIRILKLSD